MSVILTTSEDTSKVLTSKEYNRLQTVRKSLESGVSPYETINTLALGTTKERVKVESHKELTPNERRKRFKNPRLEYGSHKWAVIDGETDVVPDKQKGPVCIACSKAIETITAVYGRIVTQMIRRAIDFLKPVNGELKEARKIIGYPVYRTGYCCNTCFDSLYADIYYDSKGVMKRGIELLEPPILKVKESYSSGNGRERIHTVPAALPYKPTKDDNLPRGKERLKRVSTISLGKGGQILEADDEEWIIGKLPAKSAVVERVDPNGFYRFTKTGRRKVG